MQEGWSSWEDRGAIPRSFGSERCAWCTSGRPSEVSAMGGDCFAVQLGLHRETLRRWMLEQEVEAGERPGLTRSERSRIAALERENRELVRANEVLRRRRLSSGGARPPTQEVVRYVDAYRTRFGVEPICRVLQVASSSFYAAKRRQPGQRHVRDEALKTAIGRVHPANYGVYGARKVWRQLHRDGIAGCSLHRGAADASARPRFTDARLILERSLAKRRGRCLCVERHPVP